MNELINKMKTALVGKNVWLGKFEWGTITDLEFNEKAENARNFVAVFVDDSRLRFTKNEVEALIDKGSFDLRVIEVYVR